MNGSQVTVRIGEGGVDLNGPGVALQGSLDVLHLLQRVAHVGVGVSKRGADPKWGDKYVMLKKILILTQPQDQISAGYGLLVCWPARVAHLMASL